MKELDTNFYRIRFLPTRYFEVLNKCIKPRYNTVVPKNRKYVNRILKRFEEMGWKKRFLKYKFRYLSDEHIQGLPIDFFIFKMVNFWFTRLEDNSHMEVAFRSVGLNEKVAKYLYRIYKPLKNTCYTHNQLLDMGVEHLLGCNSPLFGSSTHEVIQEILETEIHPD